MLAAVIRSASSSSGDKGDPYMESSDLSIARFHAGVLRTGCVRFVRLHDCPGTLRALDHDRDFQANEKH